MTAEGHADPPARTAPAPIFLLDTNVVMAFLRSAPQERVLLETAEPEKWAFAIISQVADEVNWLRQNQGIDGQAIPRLRVFRPAFGQDHITAMNEQLNFWANPPLTNVRPNGIAEGNRKPPNLVDFQFLFSPLVLAGVAGIVTNDLRIHDEYDAMSAGLRERFSCYDVIELVASLRDGTAFHRSPGTAVSSRKRRGLAPAVGTRAPAPASPGRERAEQPQNKAHHPNSNRGLPAVRIEFLKRQLARLDPTRLGRPLSDYEEALRKQYQVVYDELVNQGQAGPSKSLTRNSGSAAGVPTPAKHGPANEEAMSGTENETLDSVRRELRRLEFEQMTRVLTHAKEKSLLEQLDRLRRQVRDKEAEEAAAGNGGRHSALDAASRIHWSEMVPAHTSLPPDKKGYLLDTSILVGALAESGTTIGRVDRIERKKSVYATTVQVLREFDGVCRKLDSNATLPSLMPVLEPRFATVHLDHIQAVLAFWSTQSLNAVRPQGVANPASAHPSMKDLQLLLTPLVVEDVVAIVTDDLRIHDEYDLLPARWRARFACFDSKEFKRLILEGKKNPQEFSEARSDRRHYLDSRDEIRPGKGKRKGKPAFKRSKQAALQPRGFLKYGGGWRPPGF